MTANQSSPAGGGYPRSYALLGGVGLLVVLFLMAFALTALNPQVKEDNQEAADQRATLEAKRPELLAALHGANEAARIAAVPYLARDEALRPEMARVLEQTGTRELALAYCSTCDWMLQQATTRWAAMHGFAAYQTHDRGGKCHCSLRPLPTKVP